MQFPNLWLAGNADFLFTIYQSVGNGVSGGGGVVAPHTGYIYNLKESLDGDVDPSLPRVSQWVIKIPTSKGNTDFKTNPNYRK